MDDPLGDQVRRVVVLKWLLAAPPATGAGRRPIATARSAIPGPQSLRGDLTDSIEGLADHDALSVIAAWQARIERQLASTALNAPLEPNELWRVSAAESDGWPRAVEADRRRVAPTGGES